MQWFKSHTSLRHKPEYRRMSPLARNAFDNAMRTAADLEHGDSLATDGGLPLNDEELCYNLIIPQKNLKGVLGELLSAGFFTKDEHGIIHIAKFTEKAGTSTDRVRKHREKKHLEALHETVSETVSVTQECNGFGNGVTKQTEIEIETETDTNVSGAKRPPNPVFALAEWLQQEAVAVNLVSAVTDKAIRADLAAAKELLGQWDESECKRRAKLMLEALATGEIERGSPTCRQLVKAWDWRCVSTGKVTRLPRREAEPEMRPRMIIR